VSTFSDSSNCDPHEFRRELANLDHAVALERVGGDLPLLQEIAQMFVDTAPEMMADIHAGLAAGDAKALERAAHSLKGCVCNFGANSAYHGARNLEMLARAGNLTDSVEAFRRLDLAIQALVEELTDLVAQRS
jgi:HPt (histidine-containing phosphotransfer) domain-containing protein